MGLWDDVSATALEGLDRLLYTAESDEDRALRRAGSVMAQEIKPEGSGPLGIWGDVLQDVLKVANPIEWMGGMGPSAKAAGIFRELGLMRQGGALSPEMFARAIMEQPRYARYKQLTENIARKGLGEEFLAYRGARVPTTASDYGDPIFQKGMTPATAVTLDPKMGVTFAKDPALAGGTGLLTEFRLTPESILSFLPKRKTGFAHEKELLVDPRWAKRVEPIMELEGTKAGPTRAKEAVTGLVQDIVEDAIKPLKGAPKRIPGAGIELESSVEKSLRKKVLDALTAVEKARTTGKPGYYEELAKPAPGYAANILKFLGIE